MKIISRLYQYPKDFINWLKNRKEGRGMEVTIDNITMKRITLDVHEVKEAIKVYIASHIQPKIENIDDATVKLHNNGAFVEIIISEMPDLPDVAPPCVELGTDSIETGDPIHPDKMMENLERSFVPEKED